MVREGANLGGLRSVVGGGEKEDLQRIGRGVSGTLYVLQPDADNLRNAGRSLHHGGVEVHYQLDALCVNFEAGLC